MHLGVFLFFPHAGVMFLVTGTSVVSSHHPVFVGTVFQGRTQELTDGGVV